MADNKSIVGLLGANGGSESVSLFRNDALGMFLPRVRALPSIAYTNHPSGKLTRLPDCVSENDKVIWNNASATNDSVLISSGAFASRIIAR